MKNPYSRPDWKKLRRRKLAEQPLCEACHLARAVHVDHIKAHRGNERLFLDYANLRALCHSCHSVKTRMRDGGGGHAPSERPLPGTAIDGWPISEDHHWNKR